MGTRHAGILGMTQSGKSTFAQFLCRQFAKEGRQCLVYDLTLTDEEMSECLKHSPGCIWEANFTTNDEREFLDAFWACVDSIVFVEEGTESAGRARGEIVFTATRGSHQVGSLGAGNSLFYIAHGFTELNKTIRNNLSEYFIFRVTAESAKDLANEFDDEDLRKASKLQPGEFYHVSTDQPVTKWRLDLKEGRLVREKS